MKKKFKRVLSTILTAAIVVCFPVFSTYAKGDNIEEFTETIAESAVGRASSSVIANGTYYIKNVAFYGSSSVVQIDNNVSPKTSGAILELWGDDKGTDQQWTITLLNTGYYRILSVASGLAITAPSKKDAACTQETYTGADTQQWRITYTNNMFKLSPKSNLSYYMAAGNGIFTNNGRNVEMRENQSDNKDEWYLLSTSKRYSQVSIGSSYDASLNSAVSESYEKYAHASGSTYTSINKNIFLNELKSSAYFGAMVHGNGSALLLDENDKTKVLTLNDISSIPSSSFNSVKVVILTSCDSWEFVDLLHSKGVDVVIGFWNKIEQATGAYWTEQFVNAYSQGLGVTEALKIAHKALKKEFSSAAYQEVIELIYRGVYVQPDDLIPTDWEI